MTQEQESIEAIEARKEIALDARARLKELDELFHEVDEMVVREDFFDNLVTEGEGVLQMLEPLAQLDIEAVLVMGDKKFDSDTMKLLGPYIDHDLKNLFQRVRGMTPLVYMGIKKVMNGEDFSQDRIRDFWQRAEHSWDRFVLLSDEIYSRAVDPKAVSKEFIKPTRMSVILENLEKHVKEDYFVRDGTPDVSLSLAPGVEDVVLDCNPGTVYGRVVNAINNPAKKKDIGATKVTIEVFTEGDQLVIEIADDGRGMTQEQLGEELFVPGKTNTDKGTGFGSAYTDSLVTSMGGRLSIESRVEGQEVATFDTGKEDVAMKAELGEHGTVMRISFPIQK